MKRRPTRRAFVVAGVGLLLLLAGSTAQAGWLFVLAAGVWGLVAASVAGSGYRGATFQTDAIPPRVGVGEEMQIDFTFRNRRRRTPLSLMEYRSPAIGTIASQLPSGPREEATRFWIKPRATRRGVHTGAEATFITGAPFGMVRTRATFRLPDEVVVVPYWVELDSFPILEPSSTPAEMLHERARTGAGQEYLGVREYRPGDALRAIHWPSTARAARLIVREFEEEGASPVAILLAGGEAGEAPESAFEYLVSAVASIANYAITTGHPIRLYRAVPSGVEQLANPGRADVLDWLAAATPFDGALDPLAVRALTDLGRRGTVVIAAPTHGTAGASLTTTVRMVQGAGARAIVVTARSSTWDPALVESHPSQSAGGRAFVRVLERARDLAECLQG